MASTSSVISVADDRPPSATASTSKLLAPVDPRNYDPTKDPYIRHLNLPVIAVGSVVIVLAGAALVAFEIIALVFAGVNGTRFLYEGAAPGIWTGAFYISLAILGLFIRRQHSATKPIRRWLVVTYVAASLFGCILNIIMISVVAFVLSTDGGTYRLCFGSSSTCMFNFDDQQQPAETGTQRSSSYDRIALHDSFAQFMFCSLIAHVFLFMFGCGIVVVSVRWFKFLKYGVCGRRVVVKPVIKANRF